MAEGGTTELILKYSADISALVAQANLIQQELKKIESAAGSSAGKVTDSFKSQAGIIETIRARIQSLTVARDKDSDPARIQRFNDLISQQQQRLAGLTKINPGQAIKKGLDDATDSANKTQNEFQRLESRIRSVGERLVSFFVIDRVLHFGEELFQAFEKAELGAKKLESAVGANGGLLSDFNELTSQAEELQKVSIFSNKTIKSAQTLALQFGLSADAVKNLIPIVTDFASATGQDLESALSAVLRGTEGSARALKIYGIEVDVNATRAQRFAGIQQQLTEKFAGQSKVVAETAGGSLKVLANAYDDLKEKIGGFIAPAVAGFAQLLDATIELTKPKLSTTLQNEKTAFEQAQVELSGLNIGSSRRVEIIKQLQSQYPQYLSNLNAETVSNQDLNKALDKVNNSLIVKIAIQKLDEEVQDQLEKTGEKLKDVTDSRAVAIDALNTVLKIGRGVNESFNKSQLAGLPLEVQIQELLNGNIKLRGVSAASLSNLGKAYKDVQSTTRAYSESQLKADDAVKKRIEEEKDLFDIFGIRQGQEKKAVATGLETLTDDEKAKQAAKELKALESVFASEREALLLRNLTKAQLDNALTLQDLSEVDRRIAILKRLDQPTGEEEKKLANIKIEARKKALEQDKILSDLEQQAHNLDFVEQTELNKKLIKNEQDKQAAISKLQDSFTIRFPSISRETTATQSDLDKLNSAVDAVTKSFNDLGDAEINASRTESIFTQQKDQAAIFNNELEKVIANIEQAAGEKTIQVQTDFTANGQTSKEDVQRNADDIAEIESQKNIKIAKAKLGSDQQILANAKNFNQQLLIIGSKGQIDELALETSVTKDKIALGNLYLKAKQDQAAKELAIAQQKAEIENQIVETLTNGLIQLVSDSLKQQAQLNIDQAEKQKDDTLKALDDQIKANQDARDKDLIGRKDFESTNKKLLDQRVAAQTAADAKIAKAKRDAAIADKEAAIFSIIINTAASAIKTAASVPYPANIPLVALAIALGAAELAVVLAKPIPKFYSGTSYVERGANKSGRDTIPAMLNEGERVVTTDRNKKHWDIYESLDKGVFDDLVKNIYVAPVLIDQKKAFEKELLTVKDEKKSSRIRETINILEKRIQENQRSITRKEVERIIELSEKNISTESVLNKVSAFKMSEFKNITNIVNNSINIITKSSQSSEEKIKNITSIVGQAQRVIERNLFTENLRVSVSEFSNTVIDERFSELKSILLSKNIDSSIYSDLVLRVPMEKLHISERLISVRKEAEQKKEKRFADSFAQSFIVNNKGMTAQEWENSADWIRKKGTSVNNISEQAAEVIGRSMAKHMKETTNPRRYS